jgi:hypothetical protein
MYDLILGMIMGALGSLILWVTVGRKMMLRYAGESVIRAFRTPSKELELAISSLSSIMWEWLNTPSIEITVEQADDDGEKKQVKTKISPMQQVLGTLINEVVGRTLARLRGAQGAATRDMNKLQEALLTGSGIPLPRKGQTSMEFMVEQLAMRIMPAIEKRFNTLVDGTINNNTQGGY